MKARRRPAARSRSTLAASRKRHTSKKVATAKKVRAAERSRAAQRRRTPAKLWGGVFSTPTARIVEDFTSSLEIDRRLYRQDIAGSIAHAKALVRARLLTAAEGRRLVSGLERVRREIEAGRFRFTPADEDIHSAIERRLTEILGRLGQKLHTGRSRNDQVVLDVRLYLRDEIDALATRISALQEVLRDLARRLLGHIMPGYTHLQRAQPVLVSHHLLAYHDMLARDAGRLADCRRRVDVMPLGAGALAGAGFPIDRRFLARALGFPGVSTNSLDTVGDRDFIAEFLAAAAILAMHLSRLGNELVLWSSTEFAFVRMPDAFATGSSMMPQKRNPDVAELLRGKSGRIYGALIAVLTVLKDLPLAYNRDLQEDKAPLFDAVDTLRLALDVAAAMMRALEWNTDTMGRAAADDALVATDIADMLVEDGVPFRRAHDIVGRLVAMCHERGCTFADLGRNDLRAISPALDPAVLRRLTPRVSVARRRVEGGTSPAEVRRRLSALDRRSRPRARTRSGRAPR